MKIKSYLLKLKENTKQYIMNNTVFVLYALVAMFGLTLIRDMTVGSPFAFKALSMDLGFVLIFGGLGFLIKDKRRHWYLFFILIILSLIETINSIYFIFYNSFFSLGELSTLGQTESVTGSIVEQIRLMNLVYLIFPFIFIIIYWFFLKKRQKIENKRFKLNFVICSALSGFLLFQGFTTCTPTDYSRLAKQWNRHYIVERFGLITYHCNDLIHTIIPKINSMFGQEEALEKTIAYFNSSEFLEYSGNNEYTNIFEGKNIVFVHMEGMETFLMNLSFYEQEVTPTINRLAKEGMFFSNFYPQVSIGTSSDTEFTLNTSLMPAKSGAVFTAYYNREYIAIPKLLKEKGYETFSMHGNLSSMWNRNKMHPKLGYDTMYFEESFDYTEDDVINLGINDKLFFKQGISILEDIEENNSNYMGTIITLSNHTPFTFLEEYGEFDISTTFKVDCDTLNNDISENSSNGICTKTTDYLSDSAVGRYIKSAHYADSALGDFIEMIENSDYFNDTIFVFYGDHDVKLSRKEKNYLYNYNPETGKLLTEGDENWINYDSYAHDLNKKTPLIIWTKDEGLRKKINKTVDYPMGMIDVMPTIGNMLGITNPYALGHDIFNIKDNNFIVFTNGNILTNKIYYNSNDEDYILLNNNKEVEKEYVDTLIDKSEQLLDISNYIIVYNLLTKDLHNDSR